MKIVQMVIVRPTWSEAFAATVERANNILATQEDATSFTIEPQGDEDDPPTYVLTVHSGPQPTLADL